MELKLRMMSRSRQKEPAPPKEEEHPEPALGSPQTVVVRRSSACPLEQVPVPEGSSRLHAGLMHLQEQAGLDAVDEWFVIEQ